MAPYPAHKSFFLYGSARHLTFGVGWPVERKAFWITFTILGLLGLWGLPFLWAVTLLGPIGVICWWILFRTDLR